MMACTTAWGLACLLAVLLSGSVHTVAAACEAGQLHVQWQGFSYAWEHKVLGFETPHRVGSLSTGFGPTQCASATAAPSTEYSACVHPGVDGDYASVVSAFSPVEVLNTSAAIYRLSANALVVDHSTGGEHPTALSQLNFSSFVALPKEPAFGTYGLLLDGFNISMRCVGETCNSNAAWISEFDLELDAPELCTYSPSLNGLTCNASLTLERSWAPLHGGGKPFNPSMEFNVTIRSTLLVAADLQSASSGVGSSFPFPARKPETGGVDFPQLPATGTGALMGFTGFSWGLDGPLPDKGRYLESLGFELVPTGPRSANYTVALTDPLVTTFPGRAGWGMIVAGFHSAALRVGAPGKATVTVCEDDRTSRFTCKAQGLTPQLCGNQSVPVVV